MNEISLRVEAAKPPVAEIAYATPSISCEPDAGGGFRMRSLTPLEACEPSLARLFRAAVETAPDRVFLAEREGNGDWQRLTYAAARQTVIQV